MGIKAVAPEDAPAAEAPGRADMVGAVPLALLVWCPSPYCSHFQQVWSDFAWLWQPEDMEDEQTGGKNLVVASSFAWASPSFLVEPMSKGALSIQSPKGIQASRCLYGSLN